MKSIPYFLFLVLLIPSLSAQHHVRFRKCINCADNLPNTFKGSMPFPKEGKFIYADKIDTMQSEHVTSDFGRRVAPGNISRWHMGIDVNPGLNNTDNGDALYPVEKGTVILLYVSDAYKVLVIKGTQRFGFGHIFFNGIPDRYKGMRSGDFILKLMDMSDEYAIIYCPAGQKPIAFGAELGTVTHPAINNGKPLVVTNQITDLNIPVAPLGSSAGLPSHLHLYNFQKDPGYSDFVSKGKLNHNESKFRNPKDPLEFLEYQPFNYTLAIKEHEIVYPGTLTSFVKVRCTLDGAKGGGVYYNGIMDVDEVALYIKKSFEPDTAYAMIKGKITLSRISEGSKINVDRYPSPGYPPANTYLDISGQEEMSVGNPKRTGIKASAYTNNPWDEYYFADFPVLIHKNSLYHPKLRYADINEDARYPDGTYFVMAKAITVKNYEYSSSANVPYMLLVDNFRPYIKEVTIKKKNILYPEASPIYNGKWVWDGQNLNFESMEAMVDIDANNEILIEVIASEPMDKLEGYINTKNKKIPVVYHMTDLARKDRFSGYIPAFFLKDIKAGVYNLEFFGKDLAGNTLNSFLPDDYTIPPQLISKKIAPDKWSYYPPSPIDTKHRFTIGSGTSEALNIR